MGKVTDVIQSIARSFKEDLRGVDDVITLHSTLGRYLRNHYDLWIPESPVAMAITSATTHTHPDEMSHWLLTEAKKIADRP